MQEIKIIHNRRTNSFACTTPKAANNCTRKQAPKALRSGAPNRTNKHCSTRNQEHRAFTEIRRSRDPEEIRQSEGEDEPGQQTRSLLDRDVEVKRNILEPRRGPVKREVCEEGQGEHGEESEMLLVLRPAEGVIDVLRGLGNEHDG